MGRNLRIPLTPQPIEKKLKPVLTKEAIRKIQVEERKKIRAKLVTKETINKMMVDTRKQVKLAHKQSRFMQRTLAVYTGQKRRAKELNRELSYPIDQFRERISKQLEGNCPYCETKLTVNNFVTDHPWAVARGGPFTLDNTVACCKPCNWRKGNLNKEEFLWLVEAVKENLPPEVAADVWRRLTLGGKWAGNMYA